MSEFPTTTLSINYIYKHYFQETVRKPFAKVSNQSVINSDILLPLRYGNLSFS